MTAEQIQSALADITGETDPTLKHLKLASLVSAVFRERGIELVVGGSAIEFYTEGAYTSGDIDLCISDSSEPLTVRLRQEIMGRLNTKGGPRSWEIAGAFVDVLGNFENAARTPTRSIAAPFGMVKLSPIEELIVERILVSTYPQDYPPAAECAKKVIGAALRREIEVDWPEVKRIAGTVGYKNWREVNEAIDEQAKTLGQRSPYDSDE